MPTASVAPPGFFQLLKSGKFSDLKLECQGHTFNVHKAIVCSHFDVITAAIDGGFKEADTGVLKIEHFEALTVKYMVDFCYTFEYDVDSELTDGIYDGVGKEAAVTMSGEDGQIMEEGSVNEETTNETAANASHAQRSRLLRHVQTNAIGDYFNIPGLVEYANRKIAQIFESDWCADCFAAVAEKARESTGDKAIHSLLRTTAIHHIEQLAMRSDFGILGLNAELTIGIIQNMVQQRRLDKEEKLKELHTLASEKHVLESEIDRLKLTVQNFNAIVEKLSTTFGCRHCGLQFNCFIENSNISQSGAYQLRCTSCRTRH